ncbi:MAG: hypothetical protein N2319_11225 [Candidatus Kapabacteria bacterium]|nr:hypothetical protein [Candidatus Kapabacteria bacterium]
MSSEVDKINKILKNLEEDMKIIDNFAIHFMTVLSTDNQIGSNNKSKDSVSFESIALNAYGLAFEFWLTREKVKKMFENKYLEIINSKKQAELEEA